MCEQFLSAKGVQKAIYFEKRQISINGIFQEMT